MLPAFHPTRERHQHSLHGPAPLAQPVHDPEGSQAPRQPLVDLRASTRHGALRQSPARPSLWPRSLRSHYRQGPRPRSPYRWIPAPRTLALFQGQSNCAARQRRPDRQSPRHALRPRSSRPPHADAPTMRAAQSRPYGSCPFRSRQSPYPRASAPR